MEKVKSEDGTLIAFERTGSGPPLVLVHGSTADHTRWARILPELERHFTVLAMDRRGRGESGDREPYRLEAEFADVAAVVREAGPGASLLGHSFGALCAMEAALCSPNLRKLVLYEPAFAVEGIVFYEQGTRERYQELLDRGDRDELLTTFFREVVGVPEGDLERLRADPSWEGRIKSAHTLVREFADGDYVLDAGRFSSLSVPTLLLLGGESPAILQAPTRLLESTLPNARVALMPDQGHVAMTTAPDLFLHEVLSFLQA